MSRVVHFEINADEPEWAVRFYQDVFGWKVVKWEGPVDYWLITTGADDEPGINGALLQRSTPGEGTWNTIEVESVDDFLVRVVESGGEIIMPKQTIPGVGYQAYSRDTEGNVFGIHETDELA